MAANEMGVSLTDVRKRFGEGRTAIDVLRGISVDAYCGEILMLVGPSGCGKTTLLSVVSGLLDADSGSISVFGQRIDQMTASQKTLFRQENVGFVFQQFNLLPTLTAAQNAAVPLLIRKMPRQEAFQKASDLLARVGMGPRAHAYPSDLSGGEQQRVAIARALIHDPRLLICDEPTAALDGDTGQRVMEILRSTSLNSHRCVIIVTHDARVLPFGDRVARMVDGRIVSVETQTPAATPERNEGAVLCGKI